MSYADAMRDAALVICHAGHGTVARSLERGVPVLAVPHSGDMAENAARLDWAGLGVRLPWRFVVAGDDAACRRAGARRARGNDRPRAGAGSVGRCERRTDACRSSSSKSWLRLEDRRLKARRPGCSPDRLRKLGRRGSNPRHFD